MWRAVDAVLATALCEESRQEPEVVRRKVKWLSAANEKLEMSIYLSKNTKTGDFNQQRTLSGSFFVIPEHLGLIRAVVLAFTANNQTKKHSIIHTRHIFAYKVWVLKPWRFSVAT